MILGNVVSRVRKEGRVKFVDKLKSNGGADDPANFSTKMFSGLPPATRSCQK